MNDKFDKNLLSSEDRIIYDTIERAIRRGEKTKFSKFTQPFCRSCREYNDATDVSNMILKKRKREIENKYTSSYAGG